MQNATMDKNLGIIELRNMHQISDVLKPNCKDSILFNNEKYTEQKTTPLLQIDSWDHKNLEIHKQAQTEVNAYTLHVTQEDMNQTQKFDKSRTDIEQNRKKAQNNIYKCVSRDLRGGSWC